MSNPATQFFYPAVDQHLTAPTGLDVDRDRQARKLDRMIQLSGLDAELASEEGRLALVNSLDEERFVELLTTANGVLMNYPRSHQGLADFLQYTGNAEALIYTDTLPVPEDKIELLGEALRSAQELETPTAQGLLLGYAINMIHPFGDGNGRVSRAVYALLSRDYEPGNPDFLQALGPDGDKVYCLDGQLYLPPVYQFVKLQLGTHTVKRTLGPYSATPVLQPRIPTRVKNPDEGVRSPEQLSGDDRAVLLALLKDDNIRDMVPVLLLESGNATARRAMGWDKRQKVFYLDEFLSNVRPRDVRDVYTQLRRIKREYIKTFLGTFTQKMNPGAGLVTPTKEFGTIVRSFAEIGYYVTEHLVTIDDSLLT